ncbi:MAG: hypothetical protein K0S23_3512 [Fluviicola sp.]|jgi:hypothetical protein|uniref:PDDEXK-like family protein n=1 Tax=Fluviicola sp. TaxID=1917219 RepID=UPI002621A484|nr:PD-(D/E)XK nuclease family protein [Fluviicola sp.]MDF3029205.1 hypothetical protein [Fluviicola sp.]
MNTDLQTLQQFLSKLNQFSATVRSRKIESDQTSCKNIFNKIIEIQGKIEKYQRENATDFNVFNILRYGHYETRLHTPFLFSLLHPEGTHQLGFRFVEIVLSDCLEKPIKAEFIRNYRIVEEHTTQIHGRIDLFLIFDYDQQSYALAIENKINAIDQPNQLMNYYNYMNECYGKKATKKLIYLTKGGKYPSTTSLCNYLLNEYLKDGVLVLKSYKCNVNSWIDQLLETKPSARIKYILQQYQQTINQFGYE